MKTNLQHPKQKEGAQLRPEHSQCQQWNGIRDEEVIGTVHGETGPQARDTIPPTN